MTEDEKQEIETVVGNYGKIRREYWRKLNEIFTLRREKNMPNLNQNEIENLHKELKESEQRNTFVDMILNLNNDDEFVKYLHVTCLKEFNGIDISVEELNKKV
jgi:hypothetical protein